MKTEFYTLSLRFHKKEQRDTMSWWQRRILERTVLEFEVPNIRSNISHVYELNTANSDTLKFGIKRSTLATFSGNIWSRLKSPLTIIMYCVGNWRYQEDQV